MNKTLITAALAMACAAGGANAETIPISHGQPVTVAVGKIATQNLQPTTTAVAHKARLVSQSIGHINADGTLDARCEIKPATVLRGSDPHQGARTTREIEQ